MYELFIWIDKEIEVISNSPLFLTYFSKVSIEEIEGTFFLNNENVGIDIILSDDKRVIAIHLNSGQYLGVSKFPGELPFNLSFSYNQNEVRRLIGLPDTTSGNHGLTLFNEELMWDKYFYDSYTLHIQYDKHSKFINLITIGSKRFEEDSIPE